MVKVYDKESGAQLGEITREQLKFLMDHMEEESSEDDDYYISQETVDALAEAGAHEELLNILRSAIEATGEAEIRWSAD